MSIFSRLSDIVNANLTALLDRAEDPEKMVRLIIQEMEETLVEVRTQSAKAIADRKELARRQARLREQAGDWERKAEVALRKERDDLARAALKERTRLGEDADAIDHELAALDESIERLSEDIGQLQQKIKDARARQKSLAVRGRTARTQLDVRRRFERSSIEDALGRFDQYERRMDDLEGQVASYDLGQRTLSDEIDDLEADEHIDAELEALRRRMNESDRQQSGEG